MWNRKQWTMHNNRVQWVTKRQILRSTNESFIQVCLFVQNDLKLKQIKNISNLRFDHLHFKSSEFEPYQDIDTLSEPWRVALEKELTTYVTVHYKSAACSVFGSSDQGSVSLVACTEAHKFQPSNFW